ncbi:mitochondrial carrier homolog 2 [Hyalella azteca]|uniref:Mitochondrial carrier homolog 2 n=1 Tax=Hyalella azteca TaxID=294128 RepID=A0A979FI41_HYAAZ|nr:mitochondrial carrier homolog 2 [Hyalella azteca]
MPPPTSEEHNWMHVIVRVGLNACTHPIEYAKVLIQIGHEPLPPYKSRTILGKEKLFYPSIFSYYLQIAPCSRSLHAPDRSMFQNDEASSDDLNLQERTERCLRRTARETAGRCAAIIASQPLHVIAVRTMAEFVGHDGQYTSVVGSVVVIYREEGVAGFFAGLVPRLVCDVGCLWLANALIHIVNNFVIEDKDLQSYVGASIKFLAGSLWYPLQVVSSCMAVSGSGLVAGSPPRMPEYKSWQECYRHLKSMKALKRGGTLLWRAYTGPTFFSASGAPLLPRVDMLSVPSKLH